MKSHRLLVLGCLATLLMAVLAGRDYYKILGVPRNVDDKALKKVRRGEAATCVPETVCSVPRVARHRHTESLHYSTTPTKAETRRSFRKSAKPMMCCQVRAAPPAWCGRAPRNAAETLPLSPPLNTPCVYHLRNHRPRKAASVRSGWRGGHGWRGWGPWWRAARWRLGIRWWLPWRRPRRRGHAL